jgi:O-acetyl-ADP-ribose deacetylase (regulator of RNase III)
MDPPHHRPGVAWAKANEAEALMRCYRQSLTPAREPGTRTTAFPACSAGVYGFTIEPATQIAVTTVISDVEAYAWLGRVVFAAVDRRTADIYRKTIENLRGTTTKE